jgi:4-hydroxyphenylpyruvate dioxygenase
MGHVDTKAPLGPNDLELEGIEFVEFTSLQPEVLRKIFSEFGFSKTHQNSTGDVEYFCQNNIQFLLNTAKKSFAFEFALKHGPSISSMGWRFKDAQKAYQLALTRGARPAIGDYKNPFGKNVPAIYGIGDSLLYFVERKGQQKTVDEFSLEPASSPQMVPSKGFMEIDHLTNNVYRGTMGEWADFYKKIFGFVETRYFDIKGKKTGLQSFALRAPSGNFSIPINEAAEKKSQINEFLDEYNGPGVQHLAFSTTNIIQSIQALQNTSIETLDIASGYYKEAFERVPKITEDKKEIERLNILVDGDEEGYLLQIFTRNLIGPIFIEVIQRKNHHSFGEGNFQALFDSIERDQERRGYLK